MTAVAYGIAMPASRGILGRPVPLLLDQLSATPTAAFATWKLRSAYAGACLRLRRSSDNAEQDIGFSGNLLDTTALLSWCGVGDGFVTKKYDQSGSARNLAQTTAGNQPKIVSAGTLTYAVGGVPALLFDGAGDSMAAAFTLNQPYTRVMGVQQITWTNGRWLWDGWTALNSGSLLQYTSTPNIATYAGSFGPSTTALALASNHVVTEVLNGASSKLAVDNGAYATGNIGTNNPGGLTVGNAASGSYASNIYWFGGVLASGIMSDADIALCRTAYGAKMGLAL